MALQEEAPPLVLPRVPTTPPTNPLSPARKSPEKPRILLFSLVGNFGGVERFVCNLGAELIQRDWEAEVCFPVSDSQNGLQAWCEAARLPHTFVPARFDTNQTRGSSEMRYLAALIKEKRPHIVHFHYPSSYISLKDIAAARLAGAACAVSLHGISDWREGGQAGKVSTFCAARLCHSVSANSRAVAKSAQIARVQAQKICVIACGVPPPKTAPTQDAARTRLGLPEGAFTIASAGRLVKQKRIADVISAAACFRQTGRTVQVIVAGDGPEREPLTRLAKSLDVPVRFFGHVAQMDDFYAAADGFVLPGEKESFGLVYVEAALHGVPSVGANGGGVSDVIVHSETGFLVETGDINQIADAMTVWHDDPARKKRMGQSARFRAQTRFSVSRMTDDFTDLYQSVCPSLR